MANWLFQGNPKHFDIDNYLKYNDEVNWSIKQKHYKDDIEIGDLVFIWRSDGGIKHSGGVIALTEVISKPKIIEENIDLTVDLKVLEYRLTEDEEMLLRHKLKELPETMNLPIFKMQQGTNYLLTEQEFKRLLQLWNKPQLMKEKEELSRLERFLHVFKEDSDQWFQDQSYLNESYRFFERFKRKEYLENLEWKDIQELGQHLNAFRMPLARKRALGFINGTIEKYRKSFLYLVYGTEPVSTRMDQFLQNDEYKLFGFGESVVSELVGNIFPEEYCFYNQRDKVAVENILEVVPKYVRGDSFGSKFIKFQEKLNTEQIVDKYREIVGQRTALPIFYEIDQFFSYLFENFAKKDHVESESSELQYWLISAGESNFMWGHFKNQDEISIGWKELGDLTQYKSKREIAEALKEARNLDYNPNNDALANYQFCFEMKPEDLVFVKNGQSQIISLGRILSEYQYDPTREHHHSIRKVEWIETGQWIVENEKLIQKTLTNISDYEEFVESLLQIVQNGTSSQYGENTTSTVTIQEQVEPYDIETIISEVFMEEQKINDILETLDYKKNLILQGPPGVGKTFVAKRLAYLHMGQKDDSKIEMIQFHQSYSYEEFIRGYKPDMEGQFTLKDGIFYSFCQKAIDQPEENYYLIIDEINRGNLSKIFGELMMLIEADKRGKKFAVKLAYTEKEELFYIPKNLYLIGTMNTADRSLALVDYALRRRFSFVNVNAGFQTDSFKEFLMAKGISQGFIDKIVLSIDEVNQEIVKDKMNLGKGYEIGHSYFCPTVEKVEDEQTWYDRIIRLEIAPLLREYWFDQEDKVDEILSRL